jgi:hypothetical protein
LIGFLAWGRAAGDQQQWKHEERAVHAGLSSRLCESWRSAASWRIL